MDAEEGSSEEEEISPGSAEVGGRRLPELMKLGCFLD
jgi:hypothetical protein